MERHYLGQRTEKHCLDFYKNQVMKYKMSVYYLRFTSLIFVFFIAACSVNPVSGKKQISLMSEAQEIQLGAQSDPQIIAQFGLYEDSELQSFINSKGQQMA